MVTSHALKPWGLHAPGGFPHPLVCFLRARVCSSHAESLVLPARARCLLTEPFGFPAGAVSTISFRALFSSELREGLKTFHAHC